MRIGATSSNENYTDWDRYDAEERPASICLRRPPDALGPLDLTQELEIALIADTRSWLRPRPLRLGARATTRDNRWNRR